jgi:hypothetical protein
MTTELTRDAARALPDLAVLQAIRPSARRMAAGEAAFVRLLHEEIEPLARRLPDGGWPLCERTARAVLWLTLSDPPAEEVITWMVWLGEMNQADGFPSSEYVRIGHALVWIAREMSGTRWSTTTGSAWTRFFMWLQPLLQAGARRPAVPRQRATFQEHAVPQQQATFQERGPTAPREEHLPETAPQQAVSPQAAPPQAAPAHEAASRTAADTDVSPGAGPSAGEDEPAPVHDQVMLSTTGPLPRAE